MLGSSNILSKGALREIKRERTRVKGKKVVTDDIRKLKGLAGKPHIPESRLFDHYVEPVIIEYYIPKESRFAYETKYLFIELIDPLPKNEAQEKVMGFFKEKGSPIDVMEVMNNFPEYLINILDYYTPSLNMYESLSVEFQAALKGDHDSARRALYLNEVLRKAEPTVPALEILGDYTTFNINWCVRYLNKLGAPHSLEDKTVAYLIKLHKMKREETGQAIDERFEILSEIYLEQAFPLSDDELFDEDDEEWGEDY